jgi:hypothetical protein
MDLGFPTYRSKFLSSIQHCVVGKATVELALRIICLRMRIFHLTENSKNIMCWSTPNVVGGHYTLFVSVPAGCGMWGGLYVQ